MTEPRNLDEGATLDSSVGCSLVPSQLRERLERWGRLVAGARHRERRGRTFRADFAAAPGLAAELAELCALETECCPALSFRIELHTSEVILRVTAPDETTMERFAELLTAEESAASAAVPTVCC